MFLKHWFAPLCFRNAWLIHLYNVPKLANSRHESLRPLWNSWVHFFSWKSQRSHPFVTILSISISDILLKNSQIIKTLSKWIFSRKNNYLYFTPLSLTCEKSCTFLSVYGSQSVHFLLSWYFNINKKQLHKFRQHLSMYSFSSPFRILQLFYTFIFISNCIGKKNYRKIGKKGTFVV